MNDMVVVRREGLYCVPGDFYIDPWRPVDRAVVTHAHADHARTGHQHYLAAEAGAGILHARLGAISLDTLRYGETTVHNGVTLSLHPAGHVLGSAQLRMEHRGCIWVASGDYKLEADATCTPFESVPCHTYITESTFGMPIYRWQPPADLFADINAWWRRNAAEGRASVLFCYAFGKAQRILHSLDPDIGPILCHGAVEPLNRLYRAAGVALPPTMSVAGVTDKTLFRRAMVLAPPSAAGSPWIRRFGDYSDAFASGWMQLRGARRRRGVDRGFVLSDHADWPGLLSAIHASGAGRIIVTHGQIQIMVRWLQQQGLDADAFDTEYGDEEKEEAVPAASSHDAPPGQSGAEASLSVSQTGTSVEHGDA